MSLYDRDDPNAQNYAARHREVQAEVTKQFDAVDKARDPLEFYWKKGVHNLRDTFNRDLTFNPQPPKDCSHYGL